jgi:hypothetical protein
MSISYPKVSADIGDRLELCEVTPAAKKGHGNSRSHIHRGAEIPLRWSFGPINCSGPTHLPFQLHSYCSAFHAEMLQQLRHAGFGSPTHPPGTVAQSSFLHGGGCCHSNLFHRFCSQPVLVAICVICNLDCWLHHLLTTPVVPS